MYRRRWTDPQALAAGWLLVVMLSRFALDRTSVTPTAAAAAASVAFHLQVLPILRLHLSVTMPRDMAAASVCWRSLNKQTKFNQSL